MARDLAGFERDLVPAPLERLRDFVEQTHGMCLALTAAATRAVGAERPVRTRCHSRSGPARDASALGMTQLRSGLACSEGRSARAGNPIRPGAAIRSARLLAQTQLVDQRCVALGILGLQVVEELPAPAHHAQQAAAAVMVLGVRLEMRRQLVDASGQQRNLDFGAANLNT